MDYGNFEELEKQTRISERLGLPFSFPCYKAWRPQTKTLQLLGYAIDFIKRYERVTVRQVYYGLVTQGLPNTMNNYHKVVRILKRARLSGLIPFDKVIDDTREAKKTPSWDSIEDILRAALYQYRSDWWEDQRVYVEVWLEKRALSRIFYPITNEYDVHLCVGGGYQSWSEIWEAKKRFIQRKQPIMILYFGDLDPSGKDMPRDIRARFATLGIPVEVFEVALTREDIEQYNLPRNPTKPGDSRNKWFIEKYGIDYAVELDALPPNVLRNKIRAAIETCADIDKLYAHRWQDEYDRDRWTRIINNAKDEGEGFNG